MTTTNAKKVAVNFDYESIWGMPWHDAYDLEAATRQILAVLEKHGVEATFFVVGKLVETHPQLIQMIAQAGHRIGIHGYKHEKLNEYSAEELAAFEKQLTTIEQKVSHLTGRRPTAFRSPYLMGPDFYSPELYDILSRHHYHYVSNREIRYQQELFHPQRLRFGRWLDKDTAFTRLLTVLLNLRLVLSESTSERNGLHRLVDNLHWLLNGCTPFVRNDLLEVPVYSPLDCDLLGLPRPGQPSPRPLIDYAIKALVGGLTKRGDYYSLNFHDWIIGTANRLEVLDQVLEQLADKPNVQIVSDFEGTAEVLDGQPVGVLA